MPNTQSKKYPGFGSANTLQGTVFDFPTNALPTRDNSLLEVVLVLGAGDILEPDKKSRGRTLRLKYSPASTHRCSPNPAPLSSVGALVGVTPALGMRPGRKPRPSGQQ